MLMLLRKLRKKKITRMMKTKELQVLTKRTTRLTISKT
jgi:hypothetical protein